MRLLLSLQSVSQSLIPFFILAKDGNNNVALHLDGVEYFNFQPLSKCSCSLSAAAWWLGFIDVVSERMCR